MKILIVGLGSIGQRHLRNIHTLLGNKSQISAYRTRKESTVLTDSMSIEEGARLDKKYEYSSFDTLKDALADSPEIVFICNPTSLHMPVALAAAEQGCHLFIEKPLSHNLKGIKSLISLVEEKNLVAYVGFQLRFHPCFHQLKKSLIVKNIGGILSVHLESGEYLPGWHKWEDYRQTYAARKNLGGGVILTQMHEIDYALALFGLPESVYALGGHFSSLDLDVEDVVDVLMEFPYKERKLPAFFHLDYLQRPPTRKCRVIGEKGTITMDLISRNVLLRDNNGNEERFEYKGFQRNQLYLDEMKHFFACIRGEEKPLNDIHTAFKGMKVAMAVKESMEKRKKVILKYRV